MQKNNIGEEGAKELPKMEGHVRGLRYELRQTKGAKYAGRGARGGCIRKSLG